MYLTISDIPEHKSNLGIYLFQEFLQKFVGIENITFGQTILYLITFHLLFGFKGFFIFLGIFIFFSAIIVNVFISMGISQNKDVKKNYDSDSHPDIYSGI